MHQALSETDHTEEEAFNFLLILRDSGVTNMFGAGPYIAQRFGVRTKEANRLLVAWMETFATKQGSTP